MSITGIPVFHFWGKPKTYRLTSYGHVPYPWRYFVGPKIDPIFSGTQTLSWAEEITQENSQETLHENNAITPITIVYNFQRQIDKTSHT